jgi:hypothetical protein
MRKKQKIHKIHKRKEEIKLESAEEVLENVLEKKPKDRTIKDFARKFYEIMKSTNGFVDGVYLTEKLEESGWMSNDSPVLWRIWRQVEHEYPKSIEFTAQTPVFWTKRPSGWRYLGPPDFENRKRKKLK